ncbi:hypothetical protein DKX38_027247 [Salix brachista]|uniref:Elongator complex protein 5 n=1 Tax=Salix brachista TaxID=2182728 RepID=A0A5N5JBJ1_9ROSI|nr:hypothetical protein DKX38_027247 [Salix brachista]
MAASMCRTLRDGSLEGEQAPALTIKDTTASPFGSHVFSHVLSQLSSFILASKSQSRCIVIVAFSRSPSFDVDLLKRRGIDVKSYHKCIVGVAFRYWIASRIRLNVKDLDKLYSLILELGKGLVGQGKKCFSVAIDSVILQPASLNF